MATSFQVVSPFVSAAEYARISGQTEESVKADLDRGYLPFYQRTRGAKRMVNMVALHQLAHELTESSSPWNDPQAIDQH